MSAVSTPVGRRPAGLGRRRAAPPPPWAAPGFTLAVSGGFLLTMGAFASAEHAEMALTGGTAMFVGGLLGMAGTYLALVMVLLASRIAPLERALGQDGLLRWHRRLAAWPLTLIFLHAAVITAGYARAARTGGLHEIGVLLRSYPDMLAAAVALALMLVVGFASVRVVRRRLRRETWWALHLYLYLALSLSVAHMIVLGPTFVGHPLNRAAWILLWFLTAGSVIVFRFGLPLARSLYHGLVVAEVRRETPEVVSVICRGRHLERLPASGGQFVQWRFLRRGLWWQAHPYTLSAPPRPPYLRLTAKVVGDHSAALATLRPGTRVFFEGPYGHFTADARHRPRALLIAGGIGVTAVRSLLEDLPPSAAPVVVLRASTEAELALRSEVASLVERRGGRLHEVIGSRASADLHPGRIRQLVPDVASRDVFVCGSEGFVQRTRAVLAQLGVPEESVHFEAYAL